MRNEILQGDALTRLRELPSESVHCCVTSPPYWSLRDYGTRSWFGGDPGCEHDTDIIHGPHHPGQVEQSKWPKADGAGNGQTATTNTCSRCGAWYGQLGLEPAPEAYVEHMVEVFREVRRVLHPTGTLWLNLGDSYAAQGGRATTQEMNGDRDTHRLGIPPRQPPPGLKPKDLVGIPWRVALALQADGWWLRSDIIWAKGISGEYLGGTCMPESVADRPTKSHEYMFLLTKSQEYFYDSEAVKETSITGSDTLSRNRRSVWHINPQPYKEAHFATMPPNLVVPCIRAGTAGHGVCSRCGAPWVPSATCTCQDSVSIPALVLDPFAGSGTTLMVAKSLDRDFVGIELNPKYVELIRNRVRAPLENDIQKAALNAFLGAVPIPPQDNDKAAANFTSLMNMAQEKD